MVMAYIYGWQLNANNMLLSAPITVTEKIKKAYDFYFVESCAKFRK